MHENDLKRRHIYNMRRFHTAKTKNTMILKPEPVL